jgi:hypothetical protein
MANPTSPLNGQGKQLWYGIDPANPGTAYLLAVEGAIAMGSGLTPAGRLVVTPYRPTGATRSSVTAADSDTLVLAANADRRGATIYNESTAVLYLALGEAAASATDYTVQVTASGYYEVPFGYSGQIRGIWAAVNGAARVTELE